MRRQSYEHLPIISSISRTPFSFSELLLYKVHLKKQLIITFGKKTSKTLHKNVQLGKTIKKIMTSTSTNNISKPSLRQSKIHKVEVLRKPFKKSKTEQISKINRNC